MRTEQEPAQETKPETSFFSEWNGPLEEFLVESTKEELVEITLGADPLIVAMQELGLAQAWKKANEKKFNKRDALMSIEERVRNAIRNYKGHLPIGSGLVLTWWGRRAAIEFEGTELAPLLNTKRVMFRFSIAEEWLRTAGEKAEPIKAILGKLAASQRRLDRLFAGLALSAQEGVKEKELRLNLTVWKKQQAEATQAATEEKEASSPSSPGPAPIAPVPSTAQAALPEAAAPEEPPAPPAALEATLPASAPAPAPEQPMPQPPPQPAKAAPSPELPAPRDTPAPPPAPVPLETPPAPLRQELADLRKRVEQVHHEMRETQRCVEEARFDELAARGQQLKQLKAEVSQALESVLSQLKENGLEPSDVPLARLFSEPEAANDYFTRLSAQWDELDRRNTEALARDKERLSAELASVGLPIPEGLRHVEGMRELTALAATLRPRIEEERACQKLLSPEVHPEALRIPPSRRWEFYQRRTQAAESDSPRLLQALIRDHQALSQAPGEARLLLGRMIRSVLDSGGVLPAGTWQALGAVCEGRSISAVLSDLDLVAYLTILDSTSIDLEGLHALLEGEYQELPPDVRRILERYDVSRLPAHQRISRLAGLALEEDPGNLTLHELLTALASSGRHAEAVALAILAVHSARMSQGAPLLREALLTTLVQLSTRPERHDLVHAFLQDAGWLSHEPDDVAVLLHLSLASRYFGPFENLRFQNTGALQAAQQARPVLVGRCLLPEAIAGKPIDHSERQRALRAGRQALHDWGHDIQKRTCYASFDSAVDYQLYFRKYLEEAFDRLDPSDPPPDFDPGVIVDEARAARSLPRVHGPVLEAMKEYLRKQLKRLQQLHEAASHLGGVPLKQGLARDEPDLRTSLEAEAREHPGGPALQLIYQQVLGRV